jgi:hypothetical protein
MTERYLLSIACEATWAYMIRREYMCECRIIEHYSVGTKGSHEPDFMIPMTAYGGKMKSFLEPLYRFNCSPPVTYSRPDTDEKLFMHFRTLLELRARAIGLLPDSVAGKHRKARFLLAAYTHFFRNCLGRFIVEGQQLFPLVNYDELVASYLDMVNAHFMLAQPIKVIKDADLEYLHMAVQTAMMGGGVQREAASYRRVVAWGALGKRGRRLLPHLTGTPLEPDELWDAEGDGVEIKKPDPCRLNADDVVLVLPIKGAADAICAELEKTGCAVMLSDDVVKRIPSLKYPQFYDGSLRFAPKGV